MAHDPIGMTNISIDYAGDAGSGRWEDQDNLNANTKVSLQRQSPTSLICSKGHNEVEVLDREQAMCAKTSITSLTDI